MVIAPSRQSSVQSSAIAEPPYHLFQSGPVAGLQIQLRGSGKALAQDFGLAFEVALQGVLLGLYFIPGRSYRDQRKPVINGTINLRLKMRIVSCGEGG